MGSPSPTGPSETAKRERAIAGYLDDADPGRAEKYGFRSGQNPRLAWSWFRNNPVGFNGVPFVLLKTILDLDPNHENPTLRTIARIWKREATVPAGPGAAPPDAGRSITSASDPTRPTTWTAWRARRPAPDAAAVRIRVRESADVRAADRPRDDGRRRAAAGAARVQNTTLLVAKLKTTDKEENWERDRPGLRQPRRDGSRVLLVRGLPRRPRRRVGQDEVPARHAQHGDRSAVLLEAPDAHRGGAGRVGIRSRVHRRP